MRRGKLLGVDEGNERSVAYQLADTYWDQERAAATERVRLDKAYSLDEAIAQIQPGSKLKLGTANLAFSRWRKFEEGAWRGEASLATFKAKPPLTIASSSNAVKLTAKDGRFILDLSLLGGRQGRVQLCIAPVDRSGFAELRRVLTGVAHDEKHGDGSWLRSLGYTPEPGESTSALGDCKLIVRKKKWQALLTVKRVVNTVTGGRTMALHRGVRNFLVAAIAGQDDRHDAFAQVIAEGGDVLAHKAGYTARRKSLGHHLGELGTGARGHGENRRYEHITRLEHTEADWVRTKCQQVAAKVVQLAQRRGVTEILLEEWSNPAQDGAPELGEHLEYLVRSFPLAQLKTAIVWAAKNVGISVREVATRNDSRRCPHCMTLNEHSADAKFRCSNEECLLERGVDLIFAWNMLIDHTGADGRALVKDNNRAVARARGRIQRMK